MLLIVGQVFAIHKHGKGPMNLLESIQTLLHKSSTGAVQRGGEIPEGAGEGGFPALLAALGGGGPDPATDPSIPIKVHDFKELKAVLASLLGTGAADEDAGSGAILKHLAERIDQDRPIDDLLRDPSVLEGLVSILPPEVLSLLQQWQAAVGGNALPLAAPPAAAGSDLNGAAPPAADPDGRTPVDSRAPRPSLHPPAPGLARTEAGALPTAPQGEAVSSPRPGPYPEVSPTMRGAEAAAAPPPAGPKAAAALSPGMRELASLLGGQPAAAAPVAPESPLARPPSTPMPGMAAAMTAIPATTIPGMAVPTMPDPTAVVPAVAAVPRMPALAAASPTTAAPIVVPPGHQEWGAALGDRVVWMLRHEIQTAEVKLTPPHLGPVEIRLALHHDQAGVAFQAPHAATREALEAAAPRIRELLADVGLGQVSVDVGQGGGSRGQGRAAGFAPPGSWDDSAEEAAPAVAVVATPLRGGSGLLDDFA